MKCPCCESPAPHLHPAVQFEGEVEVCPHDFHLTETPQNAPAYTAAVHAKRAALATVTPPVDTGEGQT